MGDIADEHVDRMMWESGNPWIMENNPWCDLPEFGGWRAYLLRHADDTPEQREASLAFLREQGSRLRFTFACRFCGDGITFINRKPFDMGGAHQCLTNGRGRDTRDPFLSLANGGSNQLLNAPAARTQEKSHG